MWLLFRCWSSPQGGWREFVPAIVSAAAVRHQFSSRYLFAVTPVVLLLSSRSPPVWTAPLGAGLGAVVGLLSLAGYFSIAVRQ